MKAIVMVIDQRMTIGSVYILILEDHEKVYVSITIDEREDL